MERNRNQGNKFKYLGTTISKNATTEEEIKNRPRKTTKGSIGDRLTRRGTIKN